MQIKKGKIVKAIFGMVHDRFEEPYLQVNIRLDNGECFKFISMNQINDYLLKSSLKSHQNSGSIENAFLNKSVTVKVNENLVSEIIEVNDISLVEMKVEAPSTNNGILFIHELTHKWNQGEFFEVHLKMTLHKNNEDSKCSAIAHLNATAFTHAVKALGKMHFAISSKETPVSGYFTMAENNMQQYMVVYVDGSTEKGPMLSLPFICVNFD